MSNQWYCPNCGPGIKVESGKFPMRLREYCATCKTEGVSLITPPFVLAMQERSDALEERVEEQDTELHVLYDKVIEKDKCIAELKMVAEAVCELIKSGTNDKAVIAALRKAGYEVGNECHQ